jgi:GTP-binding protein Era
VRDELPHSLAVTVEEMNLREDRPGGQAAARRLRHRARRARQPEGDHPGTGGARLKGVGTTARHQIEALLGMRVFLNLHVTVSKDWQKDPKQLKKLASEARDGCPSAKSRCAQGLSLIVTVRGRA